MNIKRYNDWEGSLHEFLKVGDIVDSEMVDHFINVMPPATFTSYCIQLGEPYSHVNGRSTFPTLKQTNDGWIYAGNCYLGETEEPIYN